MSLRGLSYDLKVSLTSKLDDGDAPHHLIHPNTRASICVGQFSMPSIIMGLDAPIHPSRTVEAELNVITDEKAGMPIRQGNTFSWKSGPRLIATGVVLSNPVEKV